MTALFSNSRLKLPVRTFVPKDRESQLLDLVSAVLALGLFRQVFSHYSTVEDLMSDQRMNIIIKDTFLDTPLILKEDGHGKITQHGTSTNSFSNFLKRQFVKVGLPGTGLSKIEAHFLARGDDDVWI